VTEDLARQTDLKHEVFDIEDLGASFAAARSIDELGPAGRRVLQKIIDAEALVVGSPTYKGSYTGLFKHFFDLLDPSALRGKPIVLTATGGGDRHSLMVEHQLRPLFAFFEAFVLPTAIYASSRDLADETPAASILLRISQSLAEAQRLLRPQLPITTIAAE
jgi:FMN reductase